MWCEKCQMAREEEIAVLDWARSKQGDGKIVDAVKKTINTIDALMICAHAPCSPATGNKCLLSRLSDREPDLAEKRS